jgi:hypothetical protein
MPSKTAKAESAIMSLLVSLDQRNSPTVVDTRDSCTAFIT